MDGALLTVNCVYVSCSKSPRGKIFSTYLKYLAWVESNQVGYSARAITKDGRSHHQ